MGGPVNQLHRPPRGSHDLAVGLDQATTEGLRAMIRAGGIQQLAVGDLRADEVAELAWSGNPAHLRSAAALQRAAQGLEDYLVVRAPGGEPVAKMRIDYTSEADTGVFSQLATMGPLQGLGIATMLIGAGEQRVRARGMAFAALGVEDNNPGARRLYERLGYQAAGQQHASWEYEDDTGVLRLHETTLTILRKRLSPQGAARTQATPPHHHHHCHHPSHRH
jgi:ribosomal protein S18 acetylase RimI-like enzyme